MRFGNLTIQSERDSKIEREREKAIREKEKRKEQLTFDTLTIKVT